MARSVYRIIHVPRNKPIVTGIMVKPARLAVAGYYYVCISSDPALLSSPQT